jgi:hypothetical protein
MDALITFTRDDGETYEDSGEGGIYVELLVPEPEVWKHNCTIDGGVIEVSRPDSLVHQTDDLPIWAPWDSMGDHHDFEIQELLQNSGRRDLVRRVIGSRPTMDSSTPMLAALHLGSTSHGLRNVRTGQQWAAEYEDLTILGKMLYNTLKSAYDIEPVIVTMLDT